MADTPEILSQEWFDSLPEGKKRKLRKESQELNERVQTILTSSFEDDPLRQMLLLRAVESYMQDVHASVFCSVGESFLQCVILIASSMLKTIEQERALNNQAIAPHHSSQIN
jgi:hypothetical protein